MKGKVITKEIISVFYKELNEEEKAAATVEKYLRDVTAFAEYANGVALTKDTVIAYKAYLTENGYAPRSINSMLASLHKLFDFLGWADCKVKTVKISGRFSVLRKRS